MAASKGAAVVLGTNFKGYMIQYQKRGLLIVG